MDYYSEKTPLFVIAFLYFVPMLLDTTDLSLLYYNPILILYWVKIVL